MVNNKCYFLRSVDNIEDIAFACPERDDYLGHRLANDILGIDKLPFDLILKKVVLENGVLKQMNDLSKVKSIWVDYQPNTLAWPIMSESMMKLVSSHLTGKEEIDWVRCKIFDGSRYMEYYILRFTKQLDVIDPAKTIYVDGTNHIIRPFFSATKVNDFSVFHKPQANDLWRIPSAIYINEMLHDDLIANQITGIDFELVKLY